MSQEPTQVNRENMEHRSLQTIMFTDVVGFSKLAAVNEERTYAALNRDFSMFKRVIDEHGGQVINTMGDGMLVIYASAVGAMRAALAMQENLHRTAMLSPKDGILEHRIGMHVGDILVEGTNVFGDGVNIAARIQATARPGAVAYSKQVRDLVLYHVSLKNERALGPNRLKNIQANIALFEIPPIAQTLNAGNVDEVVNMQSEADTGATGRRAVVLLAITAVMIGGVVGLAMLLPSLQGKPAKEMAKGKSTPDELKKIGEKLSKRNDNGGKKSEPKTNQPPAANQVPVQAGFSLSPDVWANIDSLKQAYDFEGILALILKQPGSDQPAAKTLIDRYTGLAAFRVWLTAEVQAATGQKPLQCQVRRQAAQAYTTSQGVYIELANGQSDTRQLWSYDAATIRDLATGVAQNPPSGLPKNSEVDYFIRIFTEEMKI